jgi:hypothetical protein
MGTTPIVPTKHGRWDPTVFGATPEQDEQLLDQSIGQAKEHGVKLADEDGLLQVLTS